MSTWRAALLAAAVACAGSCKRSGEGPAPSVEEGAAAAAGGAVEVGGGAAAGPAAGRPEPARAPVAGARPSRSGLPLSLTEPLRKAQREARGSGVPAWVPLYPGAESPSGLVTAGSTLSFEQVTDDDPEVIFASLEAALKTAGFEVKATKTSEDPDATGFVEATLDEPARKVRVTVSATGRDGLTKLLHSVEEKS
ncbi:MAG: hypothetical protein HY721_25870 [Planctomycetes bacterium]|nr:hypothetical protein [Planctomycetota bacterium]